MKIVFPLTDLRALLCSVRNDPKHRPRDNVSLKYNKDIIDRAFLFMLNLIDLYTYGDDRYAIESVV